MLLYVGGKAVGHCTTHTTTINSETKDRAVKPVASKGISAGLWKNKGVIGLSVSISAEGLVFYQETETGYKSCLSMISAGQSVEVKCMEREKTDAPTLPVNSSSHRLNVPMAPTTIPPTASVSRTTAK